MKKMIIASVSLMAVLTAAPAFAQVATPVGPLTGYGTLGYSNLGGNGVNLSGIQGRLGARFGQYLGVEGDLTTSFNGAQTTIGGDASNIRLSNQYAAYAVGFLPVAPNADLFARVGYGHANFNVSNYVTGNGYGFGHDSVNYGGGGQYFFGGGPNGLRADYTRYDYQDHGGAENVWSVAYVRKF